VRIRAAADCALDASCVLSVHERDTDADAELGVDIRDELIALEHSARHYN